MKEIFEKYKTVYIVNKNWSEENPIVEISFDELFRKIESSENLFVDDLILSNRSILREAANT